VPERRNSRKGRRGGAAITGGAVAAIGLRLWTTAAYRPVDSTAILCAGAASLIIVVNAVFLQSGAHPAPFFANPTALPQLTDNHPTATVTPIGKLEIGSLDARLLPRPTEATSIHASAGSRAPQAAAARRNDPIGDLIESTVAPSSRIAAVQRVLSDFGYGQLRPSGILDGPTTAAIQKFEAERKLPITGRLSNRLISELAAVTGRSIE
jgi:hypothetical protein